MTFSGLSGTFLGNFSGLSQDFHRTFSELSQDTQSLALIVLALLLEVNDQLRAIECGWQPQSDASRKYCQILAAIW